MFTQFTYWGMSVYFGKNNIISTVTQISLYVRGPKNRLSWAAANLVVAGPASEYKSAAFVTSLTALIS